jgi:hypothetical protein
MAYDYSDPKRASEATQTAWRKVASVTPGGKPFFYVRTRHDTSGYDRVVWDRTVLAWAAQSDRVRDKPAYLGTFATLRTAQRACDEIADARAENDGEES